MKNKLFLLIFLAAVISSGCVGFVFDPINPPRQGYVPQVDWTRAPLSVEKNRARIEKELQEAERNYNSTKNAQRDDFRAAAEYDFDHGLSRGTHAPLFYCGEAREAYNQRFDELLREYRFRLEQGARQLGELEFYRSRQPR